MAIYQRPHSIEVAEADYLRIYASADEARSRLFNVGSGTWSHPFWTNLDLPAQTPAFAAIQAPCIHHDLVAESELPLQAGSADIFYCSHVVEHIPESAVQNFMGEAYRCLAKDGCLRIVTGPCADLDWRALIRGDWNWWFWMNAPDFLPALKGDLPPMTIYDRWLYHLATPRSPFSPTPCDDKIESARLESMVSAHLKDKEPLLDMLTNLPFDYGSPGNHISWWNYSKLERFLWEAGFTTVYRSGYGQSRSPLMRDLRSFDQSYPQISVSVEAVKT
ncbi:MAG TPA: methyltransferase domain-containing protein [Gemmatimonadaceae bacterium]|nr:methyltransferase domain-containing protein [Gemmatimonadaceae bacterium]